MKLPGNPEQPNSQYVPPSSDAFEKRTIALTGRLGQDLNEAVGRAGKLRGMNLGERVTVLDRGLARLMNRKHLQEGLQHVKKLAQEVQRDPKKQLIGSVAAAAFTSGVMFAYFELVRKDS